MHVKKFILGVLVIGLAFITGLKKDSFSAFAMSLKEDSSHLLSKLEAKLNLGGAKQEEGSAPQSTNLEQDAATKNPGKPGPARAIPTGPGIESLQGEQSTGERKNPYFDRLSQKIDEMRGDAPPRDEEAGMMNNEANEEEPAEVADETAEGGEATDEENAAAISDPYAQFRRPPDAMPADNPSTFLNSEESDTIEDDGSVEVIEEPIDENEEDQASEEEDGGV